MSIDRQAMKALPIQGYLDHEGIPYTRNGNYLNLVDHDSLVINLKKNSFIWNKTGAHGDLGDFIAAYENKSPKEAWTKWAAYGRAVKAGQVDTNQYQANAKTDKPINYERWGKATDNKHALDYLTQKRHFDPAFAQSLFDQKLVEQGTPQKDYKTGALRQPAVLFPWRDETGKVVGVDVQGTDVDFKKFGKRGTEKRVGKGSNSEAYGYNLKLGNGADRLIVFEAPIDLLSYMQQNGASLQNTNTTFMSLTGTNHQKIMHQLSRMQTENGYAPKEVTIATDNDIAGFEVAHHMNGFEYKAGQMNREIPVVGKDWNDQLKAEKLGIQQMTLDQSDQQLTALKTRASRSDEPSQVKRRASKVTDEHAIAAKHAKRKGLGAAKQATGNTRRAEIQRANAQTMQTAREHFESLKSDPTQVVKHLEFLSLGQPFSPRNAMQITAQRPDATLVMGHDQFRQNGIEVKAGEKGIKIYGKPKTLPAISGADGNPVFLRDATPEQRAAVKQGTLASFETKFYPTETVFDIRQTNATREQVQQLMPKRILNLQADNSPKHLAQVYDALKDYATDLGFRVSDTNNLNFFEKQANKHAQLGLSRSVQVTNPKNASDRVIAIRENLSPADKLTEMTKAINQAQAKTANHSKKSADLQKLQGDMASYTVLRSMNIHPRAINQQFMPDWESQLSTLKRTPNLQNFMAETTQISSEVQNHLSQRFQQGEAKPFQHQESKLAQTTQHKNVQHKVAQQGR